MESERVEELESQDQKCHLFKVAQECWFETECGTQTQVDHDYGTFPGTDKKGVEEVGSSIWDGTEQGTGTKGETRDRTYNDLSALT